MPDHVYSTEDASPELQAETAPLLSHPVSDQQPPKASNARSSSIIWTVIAVVFLNTVGSQLTEYSSLRIMESILCYQHWALADPTKLRLAGPQVGPGALGAVAEHHCKGDRVQGQLATLRGYQQALDGMAGLVLALPYGYFADRFGRRPVVVVALAGFALQAAWVQVVLWFWRTFDIHFVLLSALSGLLGSTSTIFVMVLLAILSDITDSTRRIVTFLRLGAASYVALLLAPPLTGWLISINPFIAGIGGTLIMTTTLVLVTWFVPETMKCRKAPSSPYETSSSSVDSSSVSNTSVRALVARGSYQLKQAIAFALEDMRVPALVALFLGHQFIGTIGPLLVQYCSKRYDMTLAKATLLLTVLQGVKAAHCSIVLPYISTVLTRNAKRSPAQRDLLLARMSLFLIALGWAVMGTAPNVSTVIVGMVIAALGQGAFFMVRALITTLISPQYVTRVFSVISVLDAAGYMLGGPILSGLYRIGLHRASFWIGLPFLFVGALALSFTAILMFIRL